MRWLSDRALDHLRDQLGALTRDERDEQDETAELGEIGEIALPDLSGTRYRPLRLLDKGGMGAVWLVDDTCLHRRVALKIVDAGDQPGVRPLALAARLLREAEILASLEHPGIVPVHDAGTLADGRVFYAMKYVQGQTLEHSVADMQSTAERLRLIQRIAEPLAFAHARGVLHRDLKPSNIMIGPFGEVLLMDWGLAKISIDERVRATPDTAAPQAGRSRRPATGVVGTPGYMAPEQAQGGAVDQRSDIFSLGAVMRFVLMQGAPADANSARLLPRPLAAICAKAMAPDPAARYSSADELASDISRYLDHMPLTAYQETLFDRAQRFIQRHSTAIILLLVYLIMRGLLIFFGRH
jgi:serine/threonine protein kinase